MAQKNILGEHHWLSRGCKSRILNDFLISKSLPYKQHIPYSLYKTNIIKLRTCKYEQAWAEQDIYIKKTTIVRSVNKVPYAERCNFSSKIISGERQLKCLVSDVIYSTGSKSLLENDVPLIVCEVQILIKVHHFHANVFRDDDNCNHGNIER